LVQAKLHIGLSSCEGMKHNDHLIQTEWQILHTYFLHLSILSSLLASCPPVLQCCSLVTLALTQHIRVLLQRAAIELRLLPEIGSEEAVGAGDSDEASLERVLERLGGAGGCSVDVVHTGELEQTFDGWRGDETGTAWGWDELCIMSASCRCRRR
jgi:hypothetical protein